MSEVISSYQVIQISEELLREIEQLRETLTGFPGKYTNAHLTILLIQITLAFASLIDSGQSNYSQNLIQDKKQGEKPNRSNLETQWNKRRAYVGGSPKFGVRRHMLIHSLVIPLWVLTDLLVCTCVIINGPNFYPSNLWQFTSFIIYA